MRRIIITFRFVEKSQTGCYPCLFFCYVKLQMVAWSEDIRVVTSLLTP